MIRTSWLFRAGSWSKAEDKVDMRTFGNKTAKLDSPAITSLTIFERPEDDPEEVPDIDRDDSAPEARSKPKGKQIEEGKTEQGKKEEGQKIEVEPNKGKGNKEEGQKMEVEPNQGKGNKEEGHKMEVEPSKAKNIEVGKEVKGMEPKAKVRKYEEAPSTAAGSASGGGSSHIWYHLCCTASKGVSCKNCLLPVCLFKLFQSAKDSWWTHGQGWSDEEWASWKEPWCQSLWASV